MLDDTKPGNVAIARSTVVVEMVIAPDYSEPFDALGALPSVV